jgi:hypothetical protein
MQKKQNRIRGLIAFLLVLVLFLAAAWGIADLLMPPRATFGSLWDAYREEPPESIELLIIGSSLAYCDIVPAWLWEETGLAAYVMAGPEQTLPISYYCLREACRTQSPRAVMLELTEMFFPREGSYTLVNISYMPPGRNRLGATFAGAAPEKWFGLLFPLYSYHSRWTEVTGDELTARLRRPQPDVLAGYTLLTESKPAPAPFDRDFTADSADYRRALGYLKKIAALCADEGIELIPYLAPSNGKVPADALGTLRRDLAQNGMTLADFNENLPEMGLDASADWYDPNHLNLRGAEKFSRWLGAYLTEQAGLAPDGRADAAVWSERLRFVEAEREALA